MKPTVVVDLRWMIKADLPEVMEIEQLSQEYPSTQEQFIAALQQKTCVGLAAKCNDHVCGFVIYELCKSSLRLHALAVHPSCWRRGIGLQIIDKLKSKLLAQKRTSISVCVPEVNKPAVAFFKAMGFSAEKIITQSLSHFTGRGSLGVIEDRYKMVYRISGES